MLLVARKSRDNQQKYICYKLPSEKYIKPNKNPLCQYQINIKKYVTLVLSKEHKRLSTTHKENNVWFESKIQN